MWAIRNRPGYLLRNILAAFPLLLVSLTRTSSSSPAPHPPRQVSHRPGPDPNWQPQTADELAARGYARLSVHQNSEAQSDAEAALTLRPDWFIARFLRGRVAYERADYLDAIEDFDKVIQAKSDWSEAYHYRGLALSYRGEHRQALADYQKAIQLRPYSATPYNDSGWAYRELARISHQRIDG